MSARDDGGPAFPLNDCRVDYRTGELLAYPAVHCGMTLRDWFAGMAMHGDLAAIEGSGLDPDIDDARLQRLSALYFRVADAMIAERAK